ncbi:DUF1453 domain-containing protein [Amycolatopsis sp. WAC 04169]|uniref:DUF1453 domain-containing protein n=1 Tax=Amycolatopsis keratiniphila subsp. keratiniphila TaxID=227715 RepID=A0A1W2M329_9PSEU|nr:MULTISPECIES: DUF1453 family protein [Amycolatopsis]OLZ58450.1 DUF1453 domain-containing protein [Amycolatopsis keratiniphila subsp. nogabecina]ONF74456.1 DUF1453 domain-containing protein [Amycolatopsis keratiniphila subsp. keratiniphila]RSN32725.1 DUF1453 domain-containing protein [Amycolatopsis sp. WAC 04169]SDU01197.1 Protein of unknown function [Amycolatopsis keratiniphila]
MSEAMRNALILSGVLLALVLFTHIGRHKAHLVILILPFFTCALVGWAVLYDLKLTTPNTMAGLVGIAAGVLIGWGLLKGTKVEWDQEKSAVYTRAGWVYLGLWLFVLVGRLIFVYTLEHSHSFAADFGKFLMDTGIDAGGVSAFFVTMALTMVIFRTAGVWVYRAKVLRQAQRTPSYAS